MLKCKISSKKSFDHLVLQARDMECGQYFGYVLDKDDKMFLVVRIR